MHTEDHANSLANRGKLFWLMGCQSRNDYNSVLKISRLSFCDSLLPQKTCTVCRPGSLKVDFTLLIQDHCLILMCSQYPHTTITMSTLDSCQESYLSRHWIWKFNNIRSQRLLWLKKENRIKVIIFKRMRSWSLPHITLQTRAPSAEDKECFWSG